MVGRQLVAISALTAFLTSCSGGAEPASGPQDAAAAAATAFYTHLQAGEPAAACALLAAATRGDLESGAGAPCGRALTEEALTGPGKVEGADRYGSMAQVRFENDVVFLSRYSSEWRVVAAGCRPAAPPAGSYDCAVSGV